MYLNFVVDEPDESELFNSKDAPDSGISEDNSDFSAQSNEMDTDDLFDLSPNM